MYNICVFGGTTEGRELVEFLSAQPCNVTACVVTDYAQSLLPASGHVTVSAKKLPAGEIAAMLLSQRFDLVVDATHPYAQSITKSIARACRETGTQYVRLLRKPSAVSPDALYFETAEEAISFLRRTSGRILLTTGRSYPNTLPSKTFQTGSGRACCPWRRPWMPARRQGSRPRTFSRCRDRFPLQ